MPGKSSEKPADEFATYCEPWLDVDIIELNTVYSPDSGKVVLEQVILWRWREYKDERAYFVAAWKLRNKCSGPMLLRGKWVCRFNGRWVRSLLACETHTWDDGELINRSKLPENERR